MKLKQKKNLKLTLSDKIADALTLKPRADIEDDQVFGTKPKTLSRADFGSSDSEDETAISDFRKRNVNLLSDVSKKYEGKVITRKDLEQSGSEVSDVDSDAEESPQNGREIEDSLDSETESTLQSHSKIESESDIESDDEADDNINHFTKQIQASEDDNDDRLAQIKKQIQETDDESDDAESDDYSITQFKKQVQASDDGSDDEDDEGYDISQLEEPMLEDFEHVKKQNISEEAKKGICVRNQLLLWEGLLEMRIHLQRCVSTANQMPMPETFSELQQNNEFVEESNTTKANISNVLDKLLSLQNILLKKFPETKSISTNKNDKDIKQDKKEESDEEIPSDTDNEEIPSDTEPEDNIEETTPAKPAKMAPIKKRKLGEYESEISTTHKAFKNFRDTSIQKWNDKTRLATATNIKNTPTNTILQQISYILSDKEKLIRRTQLKRSEYDIIGYKNPSSTENKEQNDSELNIVKGRKDDDEYIPEIFDDSDFYHQLLRELIECKSADISDPVQLSRQWIALQQMRSKMKRKVDTKATKGRKIKYVVHNKLVNYMAPEKSLTWSDESTNELCSSLFGKLFEHNNAGLNGNVGNVFQLKLLSLQNILLKKFPETKSISTNKNDKDIKQDKKEESDEEIPSDTDNEEIPSDTEPEDNIEETTPAKPAKMAPIKKRKLGEYESEISTTHKAFKNFRDTSIQKWNDKTRLATATNIKNTPTNTILQQISYILSDKEKLIRRTQLKRSEYDIIGYKNPSSTENKEQNDSELNIVKGRKDDDEYIPEIFDDSDFYHQLLRELIECKSADISDPVQLSRQWIALQQMRSKMKRKVDTKATKGRKIKYVVHNKLVNYMAPEKSLTWSDESTNELCSSLFGKLFEHNNAGLNGNVGNVFQLKLLSLQNILLKKFPETKSISTNKNDKDIKQDKKEESDEEIPSDTDDEEIPSDTEPEDNIEETTPAKPAKMAPIKKRKLGEYESEISTTHKAFKNFRDTSIQKWNDKTRLATATNIKNTPTNTILQQISYILSDKEKLIRRTQLKRSEYDIIGYKNPSSTENKEQNDSELNIVKSRKDDDEYIPEIFDDSDFYHQLLRELIECKSADISDPVQLSRQWIALQQMRSKMKRKVDTKATKGRKIKYVVHNKLVNYMAPEKSLTWSDESTNELCSSLFGKLFEHNNAGLNGNVGNVFQLK